MENIYLPIDNISQFSCYSVRDKDTVRAYYSKPSINSNSNYVDFYINSHYLQKTGNETWGQWTSNLPVCLPNSSITNKIEYRTDYLESMLLFIILLFILFWLPLKLTFFRLFRRFN